MTLFSTLAEACRRALHRLARQRRLSRRALVSFGALAVCGLMVVSVISLAGLPDSSSATAGATPPATWVANDKAARGNLSGTGLLGTAGPQDYAYGLSYAGPTDSASGVVMAGQRSTGEPIEVLQGDTVAGSVAAWAGPAEGASASPSQVEVRGLTGRSPDSSLGGTLQVTQQEPTESGAAQARWRIEGADASKVNLGGTAPSTLQAALVSGAGTTGSVDVFVVAPRLTASLEVCATGTSCNPSAAPLSDGWSTDASLPSDVKAVTWRVTAKNAGNVDLTDVKVATATNDTAVIDQAVGRSLGSLKVGETGTATFTTSIDSTVHASVALSGVFAGDGPDGEPLVSRFTDSAGTAGRVPSDAAQASAAVSSAPSPAPAPAPTAAEPAPAPSAALAAPMGIAAAAAPIAPSDAAVTTWKLDNVWTSPESGTVGNGATAKGTVYVSLNGPDGAHGTADNAIVTLTAAHGVFTSVPASCVTTGDVQPPSSISGGGGTLTCNLGTVDNGTAYRIDYGVLAAGANGDPLSVTATAGTATASTGTLMTISATEGIDLVFDSGHSVRLSTGLQFPNSASGLLPFGIRVPNGAGWPSGQITFDVTVGSGSVSNAASVVKVSGCVNDLGEPLQLTTVPPTTGLFPSTCSVAPLGNGVFRVSMSGYSVPPTVYPTTSAAGGALPAGYNFVAVGGLTLSNDTPMSSAGLIPFTANRLTVNGSVVNETVSTNNSQSITTVTDGGWSLAANRPNLIDNSGWSTGAQWAGLGRATQGQHLSALIDTTYYQNWTPQELVNTSMAGRQKFCSTIRDSFAYDGLIAIPTGYLEQGVQVRVYGSTMSSYPEANNLVSLTDTGGACHYGETDTPQVWTPVTSLTPTSDKGGENGGYAVYRLSGDPSGWKSVMVVYDYSHATLGAIPRNSGVVLGLVVPPSASAGSAGYFFGQVTGMVGAGHQWVPNYWSAPYTADASTIYGGVFTTAVDFVKVVGWTPQLTSSVSAASANPGDTVTFTVKPTAVVATGGSNSVTIPVTDTLSTGLSYVAGSARVSVGSSPPVSAEPAVAGSALNWTLEAPANAENTITFDAVVTATSGLLTAAASVAAPGVPTATTASASVQVLTKSKTVLLKQAGDAEVPAGLGSDTWNLTLTNQDVIAQDSTDIIDALPYNGDARGSSFNGTFTVTNVSLNPGEKLYYTTANAADLNVDPNDGSNASPGTGRWLPWPNGGTGPAPAGTTGIRIVGGTLAAATTKLNTIAWTLDGEHVGDVYYNFAGARASGTKLAMLSGDTVTVVTDGSTLQVHKEFVSATGWSRGDVLTWKVQVRNAASSTAYKVEVDDVPASGLSSAAPSWGTAPTGTSVSGSAWNVGTLNAGQLLSIEVRTKIDVDPLPGNVYTNYVTVSNPSNVYDAHRALNDIVQNQTVDSDTDQADRGEVKLPTAAFEIAKIGESGSSWVPMAGSSWALFPNAGGTIGATAPAGMVIAPIDGVDASAGAPSTATRFLVSYLIPGDYFLVETAAPKGFSLLAAPLRVTVSVTGVLSFDTRDVSDGTVTVATVSHGDLGTIPLATVRDVPALAFPMAGGSGTAWVWTVGGLIVGVGALAWGALFFWRRQHRRTLGLLGGDLSASLQREGPM